MLLLFLLWVPVYVSGLRWQTNRSRDWEKMSEKGLVMRVVSDLLAPFAKMNHVVYFNNFYTSGPLVDMLAKDKIFTAGTIKRTAAEQAFPVA